MPSRYAVKTGVLTFNGTTYDAASLPAMAGEQREAVETTANSDTTKQFIKGAVKEVSEFTVTVFQKGTGDITVDMTGPLTIASVLENGTADVNHTHSYNNVLVTNVSPPVLDATSDRKAVYDVTFKPDGSVASQGNS